MRAKKTSYEIVRTIWSLKGRERKVSDPKTQSKSRSFPTHLPRVRVRLHHLVSFLDVLPIEGLVDFDLDISLPNPIEGLVLEPPEEMRLILFISSAKGRPLDRESLEEDLREVEVRDLGSRHEGEEDESTRYGEGRYILVEIVLSDAVDDL